MLLPHDKVPESEEDIINRAIEESMRTHNNHQANVLGLNGTGQLNEELIRYEPLNPD